VSWRVISPKIRSGKEVKNYNTKLDKLIYKAKVSNIRSNNSYILAKLNKTTKINKNNNKLAATGESINYVTITLKAPDIVVIKDKGKG